MSELDEELEDTFEDDSSGRDDLSDSFEDPKQTTTALTMEISKLRKKNESLRQFNVRQKEKYKVEVRSFLTPIIEKYKDLQAENDFLKNQIKEISQDVTSGRNTSSVSNEAIASSGDQMVHALANEVKEKEKELSLLNKMVKTLEEETHNAKKEVSQIPVLRDAVKAKENEVAKMQEDRKELESKIEAKDSLVQKYLKQVSDLETSMYVLNKRLNTKDTPVAVVAPVADEAQILEYEEKLEKAQFRINELNSRIEELERQLGEYKDTMSSLEEELSEDNFLNETSSFDSKFEEETPVQTSSLNLSKDLSDDDLMMEDLPSDEDLLAQDIELEDLPIEGLEEVDSLGDESELSLDDLPMEELSLEDEPTLLDELDLPVDVFDEDRDTQDDSDSRK
jgi:predicted  nucleic acid-binding Zn-ribbon protein